MVFFFFKQKSAYEMRISDWSSDVCSSDLVGQCGDTTTIADRSASVRPSWRRFGPSSPGSIENIGEPWEMKRDGARDMEGPCKAAAVETTAEGAVRCRRGPGRGRCGGEPAAHRRSENGRGAGRGRGVQYV